MRLLESLAVHRVLSLVERPVFGGGDVVCAHRERQRLQLLACDDGGADRRQLSVKKSWRCALSQHHTHTIIIAADAAMLSRSDAFSLRYNAVFAEGMAKKFLFIDDYAWCGTPSSQLLTRVPVWVEGGVHSPRR
jgi:hypothetical protein